MKGKFFAPAELMQLDETLKEHKPYAALVVSTTGLDNSEFSEHSPTRVCLKQYEWDEPTKFYRENIAFDKMVQAPQEAVLKALAEAKKDGGYDVFKNGGIDQESYVKGENVLSQEDFSKEFNRTIEALKESDTTLIINSIHHAETYLDKIGCADGIKALGEQGKVLDQTRLTQEYFQKEGISGKATLEALRNSVTPSPSASFVSDENKMRDFNLMSKEDFLKAHTEVTPRAYDTTAKDVENREAKIIGGDRRIDVINAFVIKHGRDEHILENEWCTHQRESENAYIENLSERGKENYKNASIYEKFETLIDKGTINPDEILQGNSEFHKLINSIEDKSNKGLVVIHAASTGLDFRSSSPQKYTGFPIKFSAVVIPRQEDGALGFQSKLTGMDITIAAPKKDIIAAESKINDQKHPYDTFKEAGIDLEKYKTGEGVLSQDEARERINRFFKKYDVKDYPVVAIGGTKNTDKSFTQTCISNLGNFAICEAPHIDFAQVIKDYSFLVAHNDDYPENVMFNEEDMQSKTFGLQDVASAANKNPHTPAQKCLFTASLMDKLERQQVELFESKGLEIEVTSIGQKALSEKLNNSEIGTPLKISLLGDSDFSQVLLAEKKDGVFTFVSEDDNMFRLTEDVINHNSEIEATFDDNESGKVAILIDKLKKEQEQEASFDEDGAFFEEGVPYKDVVRDEIPVRNEPKEEKTSPEETRMRKQAEDEAFYDAIEAITEGVGGGVSSVEHGNLYSDKENDHINVVKTNNAFKEASKKEEEAKKPYRRKIPRKEEKSSVIEFPKSARPVQAQGIEQLDVGKLVEVIVTQSEMISTQSAVIAEQNNKLMSIQQEQIQLMKAVLETNMQLQEKQAVIEKPAARSEPINFKDKNSVIEYMESIKEQIGSLREQLPSEKAKAHLSKANEAISNGQKEMEQKDKLQTRSVS